MIRQLPFFVGLRYFLSGGRNNRMVSFISLLALSGLSLGVALLVLVLSVMNGFDREMRDHILSVVPHLQIISPEKNREWPSQQTLISTIPNVKEVTPFNQVNGVIFSKNTTRPIQLMGLHAKDLPSGLEAVFSGASLGFPKNGELLVAKPIADELNLTVGKAVNIILPSGNDRRAKVASLVLVGVFATRTEVDQMLGIVSLEQAALMTGRGANEIAGFRVQVDDLFQSSLVAHRILSQLPFGFQSRDWTQSYGNLYQAIQLSRNLVSLLVFLIIGIATFNVISMLMMVVINKRKDIAVLQTMGVSKKDVLKIFLIQGLLIALTGIFFGVIFGITGCYWLADIVVMLEQFLDIQLLDTSIYPIDYVPVDLRLHDVVLICLSALVLTLLATLYPAIKASNTVPAEALRYES